MFTANTMPLDLLQDPGMRASLEANPFQSTFDTFRCVLTPYGDYLQKRTAEEIRKLGLENVKEELKTNEGEARVLAKVDGLVQEILGTRYYLTTADFDLVFKGYTVMTKEDKKWVPDSDGIAQFKRDVPNGESILRDITQMYQDKKKVMAKYKQGRMHIGRVLSKGYMSAAFEKIFTDHGFVVDRGFVVNVFGHLLRPDVFEDLVRISRMGENEAPHRVGVIARIR